MNPEPRQVQHRDFHNVPESVHTPALPHSHTPIRPHTPRVLIIGYGNPLRGDDGIGWRIAQELAETVADPEIQILARHQLTPELAEPISGVDRVIFIDARVEGVPGSFVYEPVVPAELTPGSFTHHMNPATLLALARALYGHCPEARVLAVTGASFEYTEELSATIRAVLPEVLAWVREDIETLERGDTPGRPALGPARPKGVPAARF